MQKRKEQLYCLSKKLKTEVIWVFSVYLSGRCCCILVISPMLGSERMYMVARIAMTTKSQEEGLAGYTPLIKLFCNHKRRSSEHCDWLNCSPSVTLTWAMEKRESFQSQLEVIAYNFQHLNN